MPNISDIVARLQRVRACQQSKHAHMEARALLSDYRRQTGVGAYQRVEAGGAKVALEHELNPRMWLVADAGDAVNLGEMR